MDVAVAVTLSDNYYIFMEHFIRSILANNSDFNKDFYIFCDDALSYESKKKLLNIYINFRFIQVDPNIYRRHNKTTRHYYCFELFNLSEYDYVIYWGSDMICKKSLNELWDYTKTVSQISMTKEQKRGISIPYNNGGMIVPKKFLTKENYEGLLTSNYGHKPEHLRDQKSLNYYFEGQIEEIDSKYAQIVSELDSDKWDDILLLHYIHKPTVAYSIGKLNEIDKRLYPLWCKYAE